MRKKRKVKIANLHEYKHLEVLGKDLAIDLIKNGGKLKTN